MKRTNPLMALFQLFYDYSIRMYGKHSNHFVSASIMLGGVLMFNGLLIYLLMTLIGLAPSGEELTHGPLLVGGAVLVGLLYGYCATGANRKQILINHRPLAGSRMVFCVAYILCSIGAYVGGLVIGLR